jgi:hypothetical protein
MLMALAALLPASCQRTPQPAPAIPESPPEASEMPFPEPAEANDPLTSLASEGEQAFTSLQVRQDIHHGTAWYQGSVPARGSTASLYLGKLGEGSSTLRFVIRYQGTRRADLGQCTVFVDGAEVGFFTPTPNRIDQPTDGSVLQLADIHFDEVRPILLAMVGGQSAIVRTADGATIPLGRGELDEMRKVLAAYLHLQGSREVAPNPAP